MRAVLLSILSLAACTACSSSDRMPTSERGSGGAGGSDAQAEAGSAAEVPDALELRAELAELAPRQELDLTLQTSPPGSFIVRFALPSADGSEPLDAVLSSSEAQTDADGKASVRLMAPSSSTSFQVRASVGYVRSALELSVIDNGATDVQVEHVYSGNRPIVTWTASARAGERCEDHVGTPPDGAFRAELAGPDDLPLIEGVPAGVPVAFVLRSGHFVSGCSSVEMLPAGPQSPPLRVRVTVLDRPIDLTQNRLDIAFDLPPADPAWTALFDGARVGIDQALLGASTDDPQALLDAMRLALDPTKREALDQARAAEGWSKLVTTHFGTGAPSRVRDTIGNWLSGGQVAFAAATHLLQGSLDPIDSKSGELTLNGVAGLTPAQAGASTPALMTWNADANDNLVLGTTLYFSASRLLTGLAERTATAAYAQAPGAAEALALALDCEGLGGKLASAGVDAVQAFDDCDASCVSKLCKSAAASLWKRAREATSTKPVELAIGATAQAQVGDLAELSSFEGVWVGQLPASAANQPKLSTGGALAAAKQPTAEEQSLEPAE
jgi:hypothetical protein